MLELQCYEEPCSVSFCSKFFPYHRLVLGCLFLLFWLSFLTNFPYFCFGTGTFLNAVMVGQIILYRGNGKKSEKKAKRA